jgi:hypothetical protein
MGPILADAQDPVDLSRGRIVAADHLVGFSGEVQLATLEIKSVR